MVDAMRAMLDSLMGKQRDAAIGDRKKMTPEEYRKKRLADPEICKDFLCGFCPHDLFLNTRVSLGHCSAVHDEALVGEWNLLPERDKREFGYVDQFMARIQQHVDDMDRKIARHKDRMEDENARAPQIDPETRDLLRELGERITAKTAELEALTERGDIDGSARLFKEVENIKARKDALMAQVQASLDKPGLNRLKAVCDVCSAFTMTSDTEGRIQDHLQGKQHQGYLLMRETLRQLREQARARPADREDRRPVVDKEKEKRERDKERRARDRERAMHRDEPSSKVPRRLKQEGDTAPSGTTGRGSAVDRETSPPTRRSDSEPKGRDRDHDRRAIERETTRGRDRDWDRGRDADRDRGRDADRGRRRSRSGERDAKRRRAPS